MFIFPQAIQLFKNVSVKVTANIAQKINLCQQIINTTRFLFQIVVFWAVLYGAKVVTNFRRNILPLSSG
jgi:hypothetical protein